jgi:hypothetical protein
MTRDDTIRLAQEAGFTEWHRMDNPNGEAVIHAFAALVAATERERMKSEGWRQCAEGQHTTQYCGLLEDSVKAEREACAKLCESITWSAEGKFFAKAIRSRGSHESA